MACKLCNDTGDQRYWEGRWRDERAENERLRAALKALVDDILEYERVNNLSPNPGRKYCWQSVENAAALLNQQTTGGSKE